MDKEDGFVKTKGKSNDYFLQLCSVGESIWMEAGSVYIYVKEW